MPSTAEPFTPWRSFARARRTGTVIAAAAVVGIAAALLGASTVPVPTADGGESIPFWRLFAVAVGVLPAISLHSRMSDMEECGTSILWRARSTHLVATAASCAVVYLGLSALGMTVEVVTASARSCLGWIGLGLLSGRLFGRRLAWILPFTVLGALFYWGGQGGGRYHWWEFTAHPIDHGPSLAIAVGLLVLGLIAYAATPWRLATIRRTAEPNRA